MKIWNYLTDSFRYKWQASVQMKNQFDGFCVFFIWFFLGAVISFLIFFIGIDKGIWIFNEARWSQSGL